jgi:hypothetical protein
MEGTWFVHSHCGTLEAFHRIDLHWHDLRTNTPRASSSEASHSRRFETSSVTPRSSRGERYDNQTLENLQAAAAKLEAGKTFGAPTSADSATDFQLSYKETGSGGVKPRADKLTRRQG